MLVCTSLYHILALCTMDKEELWNKFTHDENANIDALSQAIGRHRFDQFKKRVMERLNDGMPQSEVKRIFLEEYANAW